MASIEIAVDQLHSRASFVRDLLAPLRKQHLPVACDISRHQFRGCKVIAAHDGVPNHASFSEMYFKTSATNISGQYYELWEPMDSGDALCLNRAYLNVFIANRATHEYDKLVSIHCDPYEETDAVFSLYKRGPHLHVQKAEHPIPKCHFPLNLSELDSVLSSVNNITEALKNAIRIVRDEILIRYQGEN